MNNKSITGIAWFNENDREEWKKISGDFLLQQSDRKMDIVPNKY